MSNTLFVKPAEEGSIIRKPEAHLMVQLAANGEHVPNNKFWRARLRDGDVVMVETNEIKEEGGE